MSGKAGSHILRLSLLTIVLMAIVIIPMSINETETSGANFREGDFVYSLSSSEPYTASVSSYQGYGGDVIIPKTVIANDITYIVTSIRNQAFLNCDNITTITIQDSIESIAVRAFENCRGITSFYVDDTNTHYKSVDGVIFSKDMTKLINYPCGATGGYEIPDGVESIGGYAFDLCEGLSSISFPHSLKDIGIFAFSCCENLTSLTIPGNVDTIGGNSFYQCTELKSLDIEYGVRIIGNLAFGCCFALSSVNLPDSLEFMGTNTFNECHALESIIIPGSLKTISSGTFECCESLNSVVIQEGIEQIRMMAFSKCLSLKSIDLPSSIAIIDNTAFEGSTALESINVVDNDTFSSIDGVLYDKAVSTLIKCPQGKTGTCLIPSSVTSMRTDAIANCFSLESFAVEDGNTVYSSDGIALFTENGTVLICLPAGREGSYEMPSGVIEIENNAFAGCNLLKSVKLSDTVSELNSFSFQGAECLESIIVNENNPLLSSDGIALFNKDGTELLFFPCGINDSYAIPSGVVSIGSYAFANCLISHVDMPDSLRIIGDSAFKVCSKLESVNLNVGLEVIEYGAFYNSGLKSIEIPDGVEYIGGSAFYRCTSLKTATIGEGITIVSESMFSLCSNLVSVDLPSSVDTIEVDVFINCTSLRDVWMKEGLKTIKNRAFYGCTSIVSMLIPESVESIRPLAFRLVPHNESVAPGSVIGHSRDCVHNIGLEGHEFQCSCGFSWVEEHNVENKKCVVCEFRPDFYKSSYGLPLATIIAILVGLGLMVFMRRE